MASQNRLGRRNRCRAFGNFWKSTSPRGRKPAAQRSYSGKSVHIRVASSTHSFFFTAAVQDLFSAPRIRDKELSTMHAFNVDFDNLSVEDLRSRLKELQNSMGGVAAADEGFTYNTCNSPISKAAMEVFH